MTSNDASGGPGRTGQQQSFATIDTIFCRQLWSAAGLQPKLLRISRALFFPETPLDPIIPSASSREGSERQGGAGATSSRVEVDSRIHEFHHHKRLRSFAVKSAEVQFTYSIAEETDYAALSSFPRRCRTGKRRACRTSALERIALSLGLGSEQQQQLQEVAAAVAEGIQASCSTPSHPAAATSSGWGHGEHCLSVPHLAEASPAPCRTEEVAGGNACARRHADATKGDMNMDLASSKPASMPGVGGASGPPASNSSNSSQGLFRGCDLPSPLPSPLRDERSSDSMKHSRWSPGSDAMSEEA